MLKTFCLEPGAITVRPIALLMLLRHPSPYKPCANQGIIGERDFEDLKLLISHQKAKHFKCDRCGRRLNTAGGLSVHMSQVHKESLDQVENALPNRNGLDVEIFGMEGIPQEVLEQHRTRIIQNFYQEQEDRRLATGNPVPGAMGEDRGQGQRKKLKVEAKDELLERLAEWRRVKQAGGDLDSLRTAQKQSVSTSLNSSIVTMLLRLRYAPNKHHHHHQHKGMEN